MHLLKSVDCNNIVISDLISKTQNGLLLSCEQGTLWCKIWPSLLHSCLLPEIKFIRCGQVPRRYMGRDVQFIVQIMLTWIIELFLKWVSKIIYWNIETIYLEVFIYSFNETSFARDFEVDLLVLEEGVSSQCGRRRSRLMKWGDLPPRIEGWSVQHNSSKSTGWIKACNINIVQVLRKGPQGCCCAFWWQKTLC